MNTTYSPEAVRAQQEIPTYFDSVNIPEECELLTEVVSPGDQVKAFRQRLKNEDPEYLKWSVITCWEGTDWQPKVYDADEAIYWLQIYGLLSAEQRVTSPENFMRLYADSERVKAAGLAVSRSDPFQPVSQGRGV